MSWLISPVVTGRHSVMSSLRASATIMALRVATIGGALAELLGEAAALVPSQKAKSQLAAANASIAGTGKPAPALADFVRRAGQTGITGDSSAIAQVTRQGLMRDPLASSLTAAPEGVQTLAAAATAYPHSIWIARFRRRDAESADLRRADLAEEVADLIAELAALRLK